MPALPTVIRARVSDILLALRTQLMVTTGFPIERVRLVAAWPPKDEQPVGDQDLSIRPLDLLVNQEEGVDGAGRVETLVRRKFGVMVRTRLAVDLEETADAWFTDQTLGHFALEEQVIDSLQNFFPNDKNQNLLTACPLRLLSINIVEKKDEEYGNGREVIAFEVRYMPPINANRL